MNDLTWKGLSLHYCFTLRYFPSMPVRMSMAFMVMAMPICTFGPVSELWMCECCVCGHSLSTFRGRILHFATLFVHAFYGRVSQNGKFMYKICKLLNSATLLILLFFFVRLLNHNATSVLEH